MKSDLHALKMAMALVSLLLALPQASVGRSFDYASSANYQQFDSGQQAWTYKQLQRYYRDWEGVRYQYGGLDKRGVDCSGFVYRFYLDRYGMEIPRSTELISRISNRVRLNQLVPGDILIFRNDSKSLHVGIYVADGMFIHASKSKGVMKSALSNPYWTSHYIKAVRVIEQYRTDRFSRRQASL
ncbi:MAG TPA: NlpC/P60 family protein [Mariprofundaceae bacterium]|nr:NlpC/P60 family protein [Mariprofundaceae bacterium]